MAHTKAGAAVKGNRDSVAKRLGVKKYGGEKVNPGNIIVRQKGTKFFPGLGTSMGNDYTIFSLIDGVVNFKNRKGKKVIEVSNL
jgi:large subunit ribosomal protein L27